MSTSEGRKSPKYERVTPVITAAAVMAPKALEEIAFIVSE